MSAPKFYFHLTVPSLKGFISFQEVSGLELESQIIEYRTANNPVFSAIKMPEITKSANITLRKGISETDTEFWNWFKAIKMNNIQRTTVVIHLKDEGGNIVLSWSLHNAWPTKITGTDMKSDNKYVAIDTLEIVHEGITLD